jgi:long-chain acyl-CoA synthetase
MADTGLRKISAIPFPADLDYKKQTVQVPGTKRPGQTAHYRNSAWPELITLDNNPAFRTLDEGFAHGLSVSRNKPFLGHRPLVSTSPLKFADQYVWMTYAEVDERRRNVGSAIEGLWREGKLGGHEFATVGIWSHNRPEWQVIDLALHAYNKVGVSLYDTLGPDSCEYIINHASLSIIFAGANHVTSLLALAAKTPTVKMIVSIDDLSLETLNVLKAWGRQRGIEILQLRDIEAMGKAKRLDPIPAKPSDVATICYTSGTTNVPKGVILTHGQLAIAATGYLYGADLSDDDILFSYLPLAHIYERIVEITSTSLGGKIGYFTNDPLRILEDAQTLKPHVFPSVPRVLNRIYMAAQVAARDPGLKGKLFRKACEVKLAELHSTGRNTHAFWDRLVFRKIQAALGGRVTTLTSGSAPISKDAMEFLRIAFACDVIEGYGMTENCGATTRVLPYDPTSLGSVGVPFPINEIKLVDVPSMGYTAEDQPFPRGEICTRGGNTFSYYYKDEKNTKEALDSEGWLHTGDVGIIDEYGRLRIIDRVKNIMKLAQGEYVALEKIENMYTTCPIISQIYVHGDSLQDHLIAVIVPDPAVFVDIVHKQTGKRVKVDDVANLTQYAKEEKVKAGIMKMLDKEAKGNGLKGFETIKRVHISFEPFTAENGLMTPTFKVKRKEAYNRYKSDLDALYALGAPSSTGNKL